MYEPRLTAGVTAALEPSGLIPRGWFCPDPDTAPRLANGEPAAAIQLPFVIRSIWMEPTPAVQTDDGARRGVGDVLPGGWAISSIEQGALTIARDGQSLTIRY